MSLKWLSFILSPLLAISLLPQVTHAAVLWQDNFDEYYDGMPLEDSPDWEKISDYEYGFYVTNQSGGDMWLGGNFGRYRASGGASDPEMKVSAGEVYLGDYIDFSCLAVITRMADDGYSGYIAFYNSGGGVEYWVDIFEWAGSDYHRLGTMTIPGPISTMSIIASGQNPVHIVAKFDDYILAVADYIYNLTGSYGGISTNCCE